MTRRQVWQYWCGFCGKHNLSAASIAKHEKHCTKNPNRVCRMCVASGGEQLSIDELSKCIDIRLPDEGIQRLRDATANCPACMLATLLQCGANRPGYTLMYSPMMRSMCISGVFPDGFDFKAECKSWWVEINDERVEHDGYPR